MLDLVNVLSALAKTKACEVGVCFLFFTLHACIMFVCLLKCITNNSKKKVYEYHLCLHTCLISNLINKNKANIDSVSQS